MRLPRSLNLVFPGELHATVDVFAEEINVHFLIGGVVSVHVADADHSHDSATVIAHRNVPDSLLLHDCADFIQIIVAVAADDVAGHDFSDGALGGIALFGNDASKHVALREHAGHLPIEHHQKRAQ